jgi:hypothetical protein
MGSAAAPIGGLLDGGTNFVNVSGGLVTLHIAAGDVDGVASDPVEDVGAGLYADESGGADVIDRDVALRAEEHVAAGGDVEQARTLDVDVVALVDHDRRDGGDGAEHQVDQRRHKIAEQAERGSDQRGRAAQRQHVGRDAGDDVGGSREGRVKWSVNA